MILYQTELLDVQTAHTFKQGCSVSAQGEKELTLADFATDEMDTSIQSDVII